jgi:hypothetical protein
VSPCPPLLVFQTGRIRSTYLEEARWIGLCLAGIGRIRNPLRPSRSVSNERHLPEGILHPMERRSVGAVTNEEMSKPEDNDNDDELPPNQRYKSLCDRSLC